MKKVAILVDSGCDISKNIANEKGIYVLPLKILYKNNEEYRDGVDITPREVYDRIKTEVPKTSLPSPEETLNIFNQIKNDGYTDVLCITISSGLSGTHNMIKIIVEDIKDMNIKMVDSKNIAVGAGFVAMLCADLANDGKTIQEIYQVANENILKSTVIFCVDTLTYLRQGGRIGLISGIVGETLNLKPIISCNEDGIYHTLAKVRGKKQATLKMIDIAKEYVKNSYEYNICISHGGAYDEILEFTKLVKSAFPNAKNILCGEISPTLGVHTGPGLLGIGIQIIR